MTPQEIETQEETLKAYLKLYRPKMDFTSWWAQIKADTSSIEEAFDCAFDLISDYEYDYEEYIRDDEYI